jgi:hypothetical protein
MNAYRDDLAAAGDRIAVLEGELADAKQKVMALTDECGAREQELARIRKKFVGAPHARRLRTVGLVAVGAGVSLMVLAGIVAFDARSDMMDERARASAAEARANELERRHSEEEDRHLEEKQEWARATARVFADPAPNSPAEPTPSSEAPRRKFDMAAMRASYAEKMRDGTATKQELRALVAICSSLGDNACRNEAYAKWKALDN